MKSKPIPNWDKKTALYKEDRLLIDGHQVMMTWETPFMHKLAALLHSHTSGDILEIGFGMAISATEIQRLGVKSHTIIEPHPEVYERSLAWKKERPEANIAIINDYWQNIRDTLPRYDGIFFDTFSVTDEETDIKRFDFFKAASENLLKPNGVLTFYYMNSRLELSYQDQLFRYFSRVILERFDISPPPDCEYARIKNYTLCVLAIK